MKVSAEQLFDILKNEFHFIGADGYIRFNLRSYDIIVEQNNVVGNILEEWLAKWLKSTGIEHIHNPGQSSPDFWLDKDNLKNEWLEVKAFTGNANFDIGSFRGYINEVVENPWKLHAKYLLLKYKMETGGLVKIEDFWLKNVWEISCSSNSWPIKVQYRNKVINNIRPASWYSDKSDFSTFECLEDFLSALEQTIYDYHDTRTTIAETWAKRLCHNYQEYYGKELILPRWMDIRDKYPKRQLKIVRNKC